jgi:hypothetical protein
VVIYMTTGKCRLGLDRKMVAQLNGEWYVKDLDIWRRLKQKPDIDLDFTRRWFGRHDHN